MVSRLIITRLPQGGFVGRHEGSSEIIAYWGKEPKENFVNQAAAKQAQQLAPANQEDHIPPRKKATPADIAELAAKYKPTQMTQREYDSFLEDLVDKGILQKNEIDQLGYHGCIVVGEVTEEYLETAGAVNYSLDTSAWKGPIHRALLYGTTLGLMDTYGNALALARIMASWKPVSAPGAGQLAFAENRYNAYTIMADVLESMQIQRGD